MEIIKARDAKIDFIAPELKKGMVFAMPTDTSYGLVAKTDKKTIAKIFRVKNRPKEKNLPIFVLNRWISVFADFNNNAKKLAKKYWPGALTLVLKAKKKEEVSAIISKEGKIAVREPKSNLLLSVLEKYGKPLTATSANLSGKPACYSAKEIKKQFLRKKHQPDYIIDKGALPKKPASTIIDTETLQILRQGKIKPML